MTECDCRCCTMTFDFAGEPVADNPPSIVVMCEHTNRINEYPVPESWRDANIVGAPNDNGGYTCRATEVSPCRS